MEADSGGDLTANHEPIAMTWGLGSQRRNPSFSPRSPTNLETHGKKACDIKFQLIRSHPKDIYWYDL